ncbi:MAG TPA: VWA domain-containing protein [Pyrinomonadaceae bacterium]|jgi:VWFA-related protein|nr:VWA domain-containing protein [Pyrinomonadaceae bacterium]
MSRRLLPLCFFLIPTIFLIAAVNAIGQARCLTADEVKKFTDQINANAQRPFDKKLSDQLNRLAAKQQQRIEDNVAENKSDETILKTLRTARAQTSNELCSMVKQYGWPTRDLVGEEAEHSAFFLLRNDATPDLQRDLLPIIIAAVKMGEISKSSFATYIDRLRINAGLKQLFGTQATIKNGFLVMYPITDEAHVDARRKQYELAPLKEYQRNLQQLFRLPLIKATGELTNLFSDNSQASIARATEKDLVTTSSDDVDIVRVDTNLVSLNVSVYATKLRTEVAKLDQKDFIVTEDGKPQEVTFFATTDVPFDLVLLLDLSGSTSDKRDLIRKSTRRFIEATRPTDRVAIVTFADDFWIDSPLTVDRERLLAAAAKIDGTGGSRVWDALQFTLDHVFGTATSPRRRAVVFMTDGADNALEGGTAGSKISFSDLLESVRQHDALIVPIYLDTESREDFQGDFGRRIYQNARNTLGVLAFESGGLYYGARKVEDLNGVYQQVIDDLSKVYSIGYRSTNEKRDGSWRKVEITIPDHPELKTRARPGYYAK